MVAPPFDYVAAGSYDEAVRLAGIERARVWRVYLRAARSGFRTGISLSGGLDTSRWLQEQLGRPLPGMLMKAGTFPPAHPAPAP